MSSRKRTGLKLGMLGVATTGLLWQAMPASAQTAGSNTQSAPAQITRPLSRFEIGRRNSVPRRLSNTHNANSSAIQNQQPVAPAVPAVAVPAPVVTSPVVATPLYATPVVAAPVEMAPPNVLPALLPEATAVSQDVVQTSAANGGKSEVQKQLEALYQADGREVPDMTFNLQPINSQGTAAQQSNTQQQPAATSQPAVSAQQNNRRTQGYTQQQPNRSQAAPYRAAGLTQNQPQSAAPVEQARVEPAMEAPSQGPYRPNPVLKFFKKMNGTSRTQAQTSQAPVPPDYANHQAPATQLQVNPPANRPANVSPAWSLPVQTAATLPPALSQQAAPLQPVQSLSQASPQANTYTPPKPTNLPQQTNLASTPHRPAPRAMMIPALSDAPRPILTASARSSTPKPKADLQDQPVVVKKAATPAQDTKVAVTEKVGDFPNPFPDGSELDADVKIRPGQPEEFTPPATVTITPKSEAEAPQSIAPPAAEIAETQTDKPAVTDVAAKVDEDSPFAVEAKDFVEPLVVEAKDPTAPSLDGEPALVAPPTADAKPVIEAEPLALPTTIDVTDETELVPPTISPLEKMKRIRERFGMKGLKGFCPVTLRDDRELIDARSEFASTHRGQRFHFASADARDQFEECPSRYVPAAYGADVVALSRDKDVLEGTLDFAAWYKGRLYLFGSQANYDAFIAEPTQFATIDGLE